MNKKQYQEKKQHGEEIQEELKNIDVESTYAIKKLNKRLSLIEQRLNSLEKHSNPEWLNG